MRLSDFHDVLQINFALLPVFHRLVKCPISLLAIQPPLQCFVTHSTHL